MPDMPAELLLPEARALQPDGLDAALAHFAAEGYARLGRVLSDEGIARLAARADDLMHGRVVYPGMFFQRDSPTGNYDDLAFKRGYEGPSPNYRKVEKLELDPLFLSWIENPLYEAVARRLIDGPITLYRACIFNKSIEGGTELPWHQDGGQFWGIDRNPTLQIWTALDDTPLEAGAIELIPRTHSAGLRTPFGGSISPEIVAARGEPSLFLPAKAGEAILIHNHVWHRSGLNQSGHPRRALTFCYMTAATKCTRKKRAPRTFFPLFANH